MSQDSFIGKSILIVDDSKKIQMDLSSTYSSIGLKVVGIAENGMEALRLYQELAPDLVSLDIVMPVMHGIECFRKLREMDENLQCFFVSCLAFDAGLIQQMSEEISPNCFVTKPHTESSVKNAIEHAMGIAGASEENSGLDFGSSHSAA